MAKSSAEITQRLLQIDRVLNSHMQKFLRHKMQNLILTAKRLVDPKKKLQDYAFRNDELLTRLEQGMRAHLTNLNKDVQLLEKKLVSPKDVILRLRAKIETAQLKMNNRLNNKIQQLHLQVKSKMGMLDSLSPLKVVDRGYSITTVKDVVVRTVSQVRPKDAIFVRVTDGIIEAEVLNTKNIKE